jgi:hypothetical protein
MRVQRESRTTVGANQADRQTGRQAADRRRKEKGGSRRERLFLFASHRLKRRDVGSGDNGGHCLQAVIGLLVGQPVEQDRQPISRQQRNDCLTSEIAGANQRPARTAASGLVGGEWGAQRDTLIIGDPWLVWDAEVAADAANRVLAAMASRGSGMTR